MSDGCMYIPCHNMKEDPIMALIHKKRACIMLVMTVLYFFFEIETEACTTVIIGKKATKDGSVIISHQEDYGPNDCMHLVYHPRRTHKPGDLIRFAFESVPQVLVTYSYVADEMYSPDRLGMPPAVFMNGINEYGVVMSSNCIESREPNSKNDDGLGWPEIGRLVMERCKTANEAVDLVCRLIDEYTFNGFEVTSCKNLTFVIGDSNEGWIIEVTDKHWIAKRCPDDGAIFYANQAQIETEWDLSSDDLIDYAVEQGWYDTNSGEPFNYREIYSAGSLGKPGNVLRENRARELLESKLDSITVQDLMELHRDHYEGTKYASIPHRRDLARPICVASTHASQVYHLRGDMPAAIGCVMWIAASSPCISVYTPVYAGHQGDIPLEWMTGWDFFNPNSAWWTFEQMQRIVAPGKSDRPFKKEAWSDIRTVFDLIEKKEFLLTDYLEKKALKHWEAGEKDLAHDLLTKYTCGQLLSNLHTAQTLLYGLTDEL